jgi:hypothetical protein
MITSKRLLLEQDSVALSLKRLETSKSPTFDTTDNHQTCVLPPSFALIHPKTAESHPYGIATGYCFSINLTLVIALLLLISCRSNPGKQ